MILDLSWTPGTSVIDGIEKSQYLARDINLTYTTVDSLLDIVHTKGVGSLLLKRDLSHAYRPVGIPMEGKILHQPFGLHSAAFICQQGTSPLVYIGQFTRSILLWCRSTTEGFVTLETVLQQAEATIMTFLGIEIDMD